MVLKELLALWHDESPLAALFKRFDEMIIIAKEMFQLSTQTLPEGDGGESVHRKLVQMDSKLNTLQQVLRRDIVTHIAVQGTADMVPCLLLISLVKDVERVGDYCKNIDEVARHAPKIVDDPIMPDLKEMRTKILTWFDQTKQAFDSSDRKLAQATRNEAYLHEKSCDRLIWSMVDTEDRKNAAAAVLMLRFYKRAAAHLGNICTSVSMPFDKLDYFEKPGHPGELIEDE